MKKQRIISMILILLIALQGLLPMGALAAQSSSSSSKQSTTQTSSSSGSSSSSESSSKTSSKTSTSSSSSKEEDKTEEEEEETSGPFTIISDSYFLVDNTTGTILQEKKSEERRSPAGLTKMLTALVVLENTNTNDTVVVSDDAANRFDSKGEKVDLQTGEELTVQDLLYCLIVGGSNEAALALSEHTCSTSEEFVAKMNAIAEKAGATNTHFVNETGIEDKDQYTTAYDMYLITKYALQNPRFMELSNTVHKKIAPTNVTPEQRYFTNSNYLICNFDTTAYYYKYADGVINGYTPEAGYCLISIGKQSGNAMQLICVVMGGSRDEESRMISSFVDAKGGMEDTFNSYGIKKISTAGDVITEAKVEAGKEKDFVAVGSEKDIQVVLPKDVKEEDITTEVVIDKDVVAPLTKGQKVGVLKVSYNGKSYGEYNLCSLYDVKRSMPLYIGYLITSFFGNPIVQIILLILAVFAVYYVYLTIKTNRRRRALLQQQRRPQPPSGGTTLGTPARTRPVNLPRGQQPPSAPRSQTKMAPRNQPRNQLSHPPKNQPKKGQRP
jgi:D-alanyl-D-alanine carboxypeptidase (penicillin-binding protein 5/6)